MFRRKELLDTVANGAMQGRFLLRLKRPDGSFRTWWRERPEEKEGTHLSGSRPRDRRFHVQDSLAACGFETRSQIIWAKNNFAIGRGRPAPAPCRGF